MTEKNAGAEVPFLRQVARALLAEQGTDLKNVAVVLPSQRAGLYLRKWLAQEAGKPLWSPQVFTLATFMEELSGLRPLATEELLFEGYGAYRAVEGQRAQDLRDFLPWAGTVLADISEADAHLVPLESYYRDLRHWEQIEWTFNNDPLSEGQTRMVHFWAMVGKLHTALNERLLHQGAGTTGLIERTAVAQAPQHAGRWGAVWFSGLNGLTKAQQAVLQLFHERGAARMAWDADHYYLDRPEQEAGTYLRTFIGRYGKGVVPVGDRLAGGQHRMQAVRTPNDAAQAWCAAELLKNGTAGERARTAVVLADENLLQPLLEALPPDIGPINITMGLPVARLPVGSFLEALHRLHAHARPEAGFVLADMERFLGHPFLQQASTAALLADVRARNRRLTPAAAMRELVENAGLPPGVAGVFREVKDVRAEMPEVTAHALAWARQAMAGDGFATEQIFQAAQVLHRIHRLLRSHAHEPDLVAYAALFEQLLGAVRIGFFGEPLAGIQVMGLLEARALDPERVVVLGAQEGTLPAASAQRSFIPFELRRAHEMPLRADHDAVQAYNFLRMLQRCKHATMVWPEGAEATAPSGPSRFILQLEHELFKGRTDQLQYADLHLPMPRPSTVQLAVVKEEAVLNALRNRLDKGLSPSTLGDWLVCPLDFHFKHLLGLRETEAFDVRIAPNVMGEALHAAMEAAYGPMMGRPLEADALEQAADRMGAGIRRELLPHMGEEQLRSGQPLLQVHMAVHAAQRFLRSEAALVRGGMVITVLEQESALLQPLSKAAAAIGSPVNLRGRLDRVDRANGMLRILDLKSGQVKPADLKIADLTPEALSANKRYAVQLLMYAWLYLREHPEVEVVQAGLLPLQHVASSEPALLHVADQTALGRALLEPMEELFTTLVKEMMDPGQPVVHASKSRHCTFCLEG